MKRLIVLIMLAILLVSCGKKEGFIIGYSSNMNDKEDIKTLKKILNDSNLDNIDLFIDRVNDFNSEEDLSCGIKNWDKTNSFKYNEAACGDRWEKNHEISDGNCRITAFTLLEDHLKFSKLIKKYDSYLMFDIDVLENNKDYSIPNNKINEFITLFNEMDVSKIKKDNYKDVYTNKWLEYGIKNNSDASLISVVIHDEYSNILFVGHAGILIKFDDKYLFIEKIAFEQPYQFNILKDKNDLKDLFKERETYFANGNEEGPFVYENDKLLFSY